MHVMSNTIPLQIPCTVVLWIGALSLRIEPTRKVGNFHTYNLF
jgi:hypothetical protein